MASPLAMLRKMEINTPAKGIGAIALDSAVGFGASVAIGETYVRHGDKWWGRNVAKILGATGKAVALGCSYAAGGHQTFIGGLFNSVGQAGINAIGLDIGLRHARDAKGVRAALVPKGYDIKQIAGASEVTQIGALGAAPRGRALSWDQIESLASGV